MRTVRRRAVIALFVLSLVLAGGAVGCFLAAIWAHGTDLPGRFVGTALVLAVLAAGALIAADVTSWEDKP